MNNIRSFVKQTRLFSGMDDEAVDRIAARFGEVTFEPGEALCREGDPGDRMFIIIEGVVSVRKEMGWGQREVGQYRGGEVVGEMSLISNERRSATVLAVERTVCLQMGRADFRELLDCEPHFAQRVAIVLTTRLADLGRNTGEELLQSYRALMFALADLADSRDPETGAHLERTRTFCALLAERLAVESRYHKQLYPGFVESIYQVSPLHDIGKVAIPDAVLLKPGKLTPEEYAVMKTHAAIGAASLQRVLAYSDQEILRMAHRICLHHHERWDGTGYPHGLAGENIPLEARIMALADVYDALLSRRVYKPPMSFAEAAAEIARSAGTHFDPHITAVMTAALPQFESVYSRYSE